MAAYTEVDICNTALSNIRAKSINSLSESSQESQLCKLKYPIVRDKLLRDNHWRFAKKTQPIALRSDVLAHWTHSYQYPSDCLKLHSIMQEDIIKTNNRSRLAAIFDSNQRFESPDFRVDYEVLTASGDKVIGCNFENVIAEYTARIENTALFDPNFMLAVSWYLSAQLAVPLLGEGKGRGMMADSFNMYKLLLSEALASDVEEARDSQVRQSSLIEARY
jgi:hypothetical protein